MPRGDLRIPIRPLEAAGAALALAVGFHFLALRVRAGGLPVGDEGSWLSVAAELAKGHGFTTRWLEAHFLVPYALPRPDDFRYPALTSILALAFRAFGFSVETGRWTVAVLFLGFAAAVWGVARKAFGRWAAMAALWLTVTSLLQLEWNSAVYTEGLFGLVATGLAAWGLRGHAVEPLANRNGGDAGVEPGLPVWRRAGWWAGLGAGVGLLYLVRANGILFLPGMIWLWWLRRRSLGWRQPLAAVAGFAMIAGPWMARTALRFGNPLHIAGNAGMLREVGQPHTYTLAQYFSHYDVLFPLRREALGIWGFFRTLEHYEHGLWIVPFLLACAVAMQRRRFFDPAFAVGFALTFAASAYAAYDSWAGARYMSGLLPLAYAYGLSALPALAMRRFPSPAPWMRPSGYAAIALLLLPVLGPHRYYERKLAHPRGDLGMPLDEHLTMLATELPPDGRYYAASLCRVNFLMPRTGCVGLQELYDTSWFSRSLQAFHPALIALTHEETRDTTMLAALSLMRAKGYAQDTLGTSPLAVYLALRPAALGHEGADTRAVRADALPLPVAFARSAP